jgi:hypothetical protein
MRPTASDPGVRRVRVHSGGHAGRVRMTLWFRPPEAETLYRLARQDGITAAEWLRRAIRLRAGRRPVEAEQYIRRIIPEAEARAAELQLLEKAEVLMATARQVEPTDPLYAKAARREAGRLMDRAAWFTQVVQDYARLRSTAPPTAGPPATPAGAPRPPARAGSSGAVRPS